MKKFDRNLQSICQKSEKSSFSDRTQGGQIYFLQGAWKKAKRKLWGQQMLFATKFLKFGRKRASLATLFGVRDCVQRSHRG